MLVKVELDEKAKEALSALEKQITALGKYTGDRGDIGIFASSDGTKKYLRVWETQPPAEGKTGPAKHIKTFYEIVPPSGTAALARADIK